MFDCCDHCGAMECPGGMTESHEDRCPVCQSVKQDEKVP